MGNDKTLNKFYVYSYSTEKDGIFYIGKGTAKRIYNDHKGCVLCHNILQKRKKQGTKIIKKKLFENITEQDAFRWERTLIWFYNPKGNLTAGGEGPSGLKHSEKTVKTISENKKTFWKSEEGKRYKQYYKRKYNGEKSIKAKLTWEEVKDIRKEYNEKKISYAELTKKYNVKQGAIQKVIENKTWVANDYFPVLRGHAGESNSKAKLNWEKVEQIRNLFATGEFKKIELADLFKVQATAIGKIIMYKTWYKGSKS